MFIIQNLVLFEKYILIFFVVMKSCGVSLIPEYWQSLCYFSVIIALLLVYSCLIFWGYLKSYKYCLNVTENLDFIYLVSVNTKNIVYILMYGIDLAGTIYMDRTVWYASSMDGAPVIHGLVNDVISQVYCEYVPHSYVGPATYFTFVVYSYNCLFFCCDLWVAFIQ
jgi:hypothetical protein